MPLCEKCQQEIKEGVDFHAIYSELENQTDALNKVLSKACDAGVEIDIAFIDCTKMDDKTRRNMFFIRSANLLVPCGGPPPPPPPPSNELLKEGNGTRTSL